MPYIWSFEISDEQGYFIKSQMKKHGFKSKPEYIRSLIKDEIRHCQGHLRPIIINVGNTSNSQTPLMSYDRKVRVGIPDRDKKSPPKQQTISVREEMIGKIKSGEIRKKFNLPDVEILSGKGKVPVLDEN